MSALSCGLPRLRGIMKEGHHSPELSSALVKYHQQSRESRKNKITATLPRTSSVLVKEHEHEEVCTLPLCLLRLPVPLIHSTCASTTHRNLFLKLLISTISSLVLHIVIKKLWKTLQKFPQITSYKVSSSCPGVPHWAYQLESLPLHTPNPIDYRILKKS